MLEILSKKPFPRWTVHCFVPEVQTIKSVYSKGKRVQVLFEEIWCSWLYIEFKRTYSWYDKTDRRLLRMEMPFLRCVKDLEKLNIFVTGERLFLHATDRDDRSVLVPMNELHLYGIDARNWSDAIYANKSVAADLRADKALTKK